MQMKRTYRRDKDLNEICKRTKATDACLCEDWIPGEKLGEGVFTPSMKTLTPVVGDVVVYESFAGDKMHKWDARRRYDKGESIYFTTWEM